MKKRKFFKSKKIWLIPLVILSGGLVLQAKYDFLSLHLTPTSQQSGPLEDKEDGLILPSDLLYNGRPLEAYCFGWDQERPKFSLSQCTQRAKEALVSLSPPKAINGWRGYNDEYKNRTEYIYYKYLGTLSTGDHLIFKMNGSYTGTGRFSNIEVLHREGDTITLSSIDGGDRSSGGVDEASFENKVLRYTKALTPFALFQLWKTFSKASQEADVDASSLEDCAICQVGSAHYEIPDADLQKPPQEKHIIGFSLARNFSSNASSPADSRTLQDCFEQVLEEHESCGITEFSWEDLDSFFQEVLAFYKKQSSAPPRLNKPAL